MSNKLYNEIRLIHYRIDDILKTISNQNCDNGTVYVPVNKLLELPDHLRKTYLVVVDFKECTARDVSIRTSRHRAVESQYLNILTRTKFLRKRRKGRLVYFRLY